MNRKMIVRLLLAGSAVVTAGAAAAQTSAQGSANPPAPAQTDAQVAPGAGDQTAPDPSDAAADAAIRAAGSGDDASAKIELLTAQVEALQEQLQAVKASMVKATPSWKGGPLYEDKDAGFSFKPKGLLQFDAGYVGFPGGRQLNGTVGGLNYNNLGFNTRARRLVLGAEGTLPGGFGYNVEFNLAQGTVDYEDIVLTYQRKNSPLRVTIGNFYPMSSLETMTSSRLTSFLERASFTDAFNYNRRLGVSLSLVDPKNDRYTLTGGVFSQPINDASFNRTGWEAGVRGTFSPKLGDTLVHLGASYHHRVNNRDVQGTQYRSRPLTQITDQRFVDTGVIAADGDDSAGVELGVIHKSLHFAAEAQKLWVRGYNPTQVITAPNNAFAGTRFNGDPSFTGGYAELGYYLTGETRGYKGGKWDRTKVLHPFDQGGWGAVQVNGRVDYVNLRDRVSGTTVAAPDYVNGGKQIGYQLSLIWNPMDYLRFMAQYGHVDVTGGPRGAVSTATVPGLFPVGTATPSNSRKFGVDTAGVRAQVDF